MQETAGSFIKSLVGCIPKAIWPVLWFYHPTHGWLWTGSSLYDQAEDDKAFFYLYHQTESERTWLYYQDAVADPYFSFL